MNKLNYLFAVLFFAFSYSHAQPNIDWSACFGGTDGETAYSIIQSSDGGYLVYGSAASNDSDVTGNHGLSDAWLIKLDASGHIQWQQCYGGDEDEGAFAMVRNADGSMVMTASSRSQNGGMIQGHHDTTGYLNSDFLVFKVDSSGGLIWSHCYGGISDEYASSIAQTYDGGYVVGGSTYSTYWDVIGNHGAIDFWIIKIDSIGNLEWQKCLGGTYMDYGHSIVVTRDSGFAIVGSTESTNGNVTNNHGSGDYWLARLDSSGTLLWQRCFGGTAMEDPYSLIETSDGGFAIAGSSKSNDGNVTGNHGGEDFWVVKTSPMGILQWQKSLGGTGDDQAASIRQLANGDYVIAGRTQSTNGDVSGNHGAMDYWVADIDSMGNLQWQKCIGGSLYETAKAIIPTSDGGWIVTGAAGSADFDASGNNGLTDYFVAKLHTFNVGLENDAGKSIYEGSLSPNPTSGKLTISSAQPIQAVEFFNIVGAKLMSSVRPIAIGVRTEIDISNLPPGIYIVQISDEKNSWRKKIIKL